MTLRRRTLLGATLALLPAALSAQGPPAARTHRIGILSASPIDGPLWDAFVDGLRERGWVEGANLAFDRLTSGGFSDRFPALVAELLQRNVDVMVAAGTPPAVAARDSTTTLTTPWY